MMMIWFDYRGWQKDLVILVDDDNHEQAMETLVPKRLLCMTITTIYAGF
jgi:hypothetical protein